MQRPQPADQHALRLAQWAKRELAFKSLSPASGVKRLVARTTAKMPPKKKSKTSTPATLPCFATARLTIIGANPVQRKIWQKCGGPTFLKPSQVNQLTNDRDYVVIASNVDASTVQSKKGAARAVTDRWLTSSIERNAL